MSCASAFFKSGTSQCTLGVTFINSYTHLRTSKNTKNNVRKRDLNLQQQHVAGHTLDGRDENRPQVVEIGLLTGLIVESAIH